MLTICCFTSHLWFFLVRAACSMVLRSQSLLRMNLSVLQAQSDLRRRLSEKTTIQDYSLFSTQMSSASIPSSSLSISTEPMGNRAPSLWLVLRTPLATVLLSRKRMGRLNALSKSLQLLSATKLMLGSIFSTLTWLIESKTVLLQLSAKFSPSWPASSNFTKWSYQATGWTSANLQIT